jgi:WD40 repeat protein
VNPQIPAWLAEIVDRLLEKEPDARYQSAREVADVLARCLAHVQHPSLNALPAVTPNQQAVSAVAGQVLNETLNVPALKRRAAHRGRRWLMAAAALLFALGLLAAAEGTGMTRMAATVIRIATGEGTLVVEVDDPGVKVTIEGDGGLVITGAGPQEVRLRPGSYQVHALKDGKPVPLDRELITISRGGKQVVKIRLEAVAATTPAKSSVGEVRQHRWSGRHTYSTAFSPDNRYYAATGAVQAENTLRVWEVESGELVMQVVGNECAVFTPDTKQLIAAGPDKQLHVWEVPTGKEVRQFGKHPDWISVLSLAPSGKQLLSGCNDGNMRLWDLASGEELARLDHHGQPCFGFFSPDSKQIVSVSFRGDGLVRLWDAAEGKQLREWKTDGKTWWAQFAPDGRHFITVADNTVCFWDSTTDAQPQVLQLGTGATRAVGVSPDGQRLLYGMQDDPTVRLVELPGGKPLASFEVPEPAYGQMKISPDGQFGVGAAGGGWVYLWRLPDGLAPPKSSSKVEPGAFVVLGGAGVAERKFDTLAEAVQRASDGDTIEIRGNGPFLSQPINIRRTALTIRAGEGFRPVITLSPEADQHDAVLLTTYAALVLEGLELNRASREDQTGRVLVVNRAPLRAANCRFGGGIGGNYDSVCVFGNCEFIAENANVVAMCISGARFIFENCLHRSPGFAMGVGSFDAALHDVSIQIQGSTFVNKDRPFWLPLRSPSGSPPVLKPVRFAVSGSIFDTPAVLGFDPVLGFDEEQKLREKAALLEPLEAEAALLRLLEWQGERNVFTTGSTAVRWTSDGNLQPKHGPKNLEEWARFWGAAEVDSREGRIRFQGGDLLARTGAAVDELTPEDFRLRPDSAGYRAGPDGKDLGADVDLVGPGPAYERWKQTPEYQQWLKETGQLRAEAPKAEPQAFVVLGDKGIEVRKYDTLAEAVQSASDGDTIEIRGNGPFETESVSINAALTIRAGEGFRPRIKLSAKAAQSDQPLFKASGKLVLEGLDLFRPKGTNTGILVHSQGSVAAANCRLRVEGVGHCIWTADSWTTRNCLFLGGMGHPTMQGPIADGAKYAMHNCVDIGTPFHLPYQRSDTVNVAIRLMNNTIVWREGIRIQVGEITDLLPGAKGPKPIRFDASGNIFGSDLLWFQLTSAFLAKHKGFEPEQSGEAFLRSLMDWNERENLHAPGRPYLTWVMDQALQPSQRVKTLADWQQLWGLTGTGSLEGRAKYQGGDVLAKFATDPDRLTPEDFRLRPDSPGYKAGKDGKDLGADVDLVGPGPAYERWKKTPEYQQWLIDSDRANRGAAGQASGLGRPQPADN